MVTPKSNDKLGLSREVPVGGSGDLSRPAEEPAQMSTSGSYLDVPLYGQAAAIRALYQASFFDAGAAKPPRRGKPRPRSSWLAMQLGAFIRGLRGALPAAAS